MAKTVKLLKGCQRVSSREELCAADAAIDVAIAGQALDPGAGAFRVGSRNVDRCAHEPTPTPYFILDELFSRVPVGPHDRLLDVGCGAGRVLAYMAKTGLFAGVTGVELDAGLAQIARAWTSRYESLEVLSGSVLEIPLTGYTHFYLFNPFDNVVLLEFLDLVEQQVQGPVTLIHMSDNGEAYSYATRPAWKLLDEGEFWKHPGATGGEFPVYGCPQHYSIWRFEPGA